MTKVETLHHHLFTAIENNNTEESLAVICRIQDFNHGRAGSLLDRYSCGTHSPPTPLIHSIVKENVKVARSLLENGCDANVTPYIHEQSNEGKSKSNQIHNEPCDWVFKVIGKPFFEHIVMTILTSTSEVILDRTGSTVLHAICEYRMTTWLQMILQLPSQRHLFFHANNYGYLPMHVAAKYNFLEYFDVVFRHLPILNHSKNSRVNNNTDDKFDSSTTYVHSKSKSEAESKSDLECCLHPPSMDINAPLATTRMTVLHISVEHKYYELVKCLIKLGANVNAKDSFNHSPLMNCLNAMNSVKSELEQIHPYFTDVCRALITAGASVNGYYHKDRKFISRFRKLKKDCLITPLHIAAEVGCQDVVQLLLNNGADPSVKSQHEGKLPVQLALERGRIECAQVLLQSNLYPKNFLISFEDIHGNSLLHCVSTCDDRLANRLLLHFESCIDKPNVDNVIPLDKAIYFGNIPLIKAILSRRPDIVNVFHFGDIPALHRAASSPLGHLPLCQIILSYGANIYNKAYSKKVMAYRRALRFDYYQNAVYLCEKMSQPFTVAERAELWEYAESKMDQELGLRMKHRLMNIPSLSSHCLDVIRQALIGNCASFKLADSLPIPNKMLRALRYEADNPCLS